MKKQSILVWFVVMTAGTSVYSADWQLDWVEGDNIPTSWDWSIYPSDFPPSLHPPRTVPFSGPTGVFSNDCFAEGGLGGTPTITIDPNQKTIELWFQPPVPDICLFVWLPVCGLNGWFGPLSDGDWLFYSNQIPSPYGSFHINFHIGPPNPTLTILNTNGNERLLGGSIYPIRWDDTRSESCGGNYLLSYSNDNGSNWFPVDSNTISNTCSYDWLVPSIDANQCLIRITDANDPNISDTSDDSFRIYLCMYSVSGDWNGDCYVDFGDFSIIAAGWNVPGGKDMNDLATFVQYWLDCTNPYDPYCYNFGEAIPEFPANGATIDDRTPALEWIPGVNADYHELYFSENFDDVNNRNNAVREIMVDPCRPYPAVPPLQLGTTYYWLVDEVKMIPPERWDARTVWSFTISEGLSLDNDGFINLKDYAIPSNYSQKTGPILPGYIHKDDVVDYTN